MCRTMNELERIVANYRMMKSLLDETEAELKVLEQEIISYLDFNKKVSETGNTFVIKISTCSRRTLDAKALEADLGSLADYQRISQYRRLYVR